MRPKKKQLEIQIILYYHTSAKTQNQNDVLPIFFLRNRLAVCNVCETKKKQCNNSKKKWFRHFFCYIITRMAKKAGIVTQHSKSTKHFEKYKCTICDFTSVKKSNLQAPPLHEEFIQFRKKHAPPGQSTGLWQFS